MKNKDIYEKFVERYGNGQVPWDSELPPPELIDLLQGLAPGHALDLGCGYGRASIFLAQHGWQVDAIDFVPQAIVEASSRSQAAGVDSKIRFHTASVTDLSFLDGKYEFALDVGCMHALTEEEMETYRDELYRLLRPGAAYLLFTRLQQEVEPEGDGPQGVDEATIRAVFADSFELTRVERGDTQVEDTPAWTSAWFWFRRRDDSRIAKL